MSNRVLRYLDQSGEHHPGSLGIQIIRNLPRNIILSKRSPTILATAYYLARLVDGDTITQEDAARLYGIRQATVSNCLKAAAKDSPEIREALELGDRHRTLLKQIHALEEELHHWKTQRTEAGNRIPKLKKRLADLNRKRDDLRTSHPFRKPGSSDAHI
jgi:septal ring factor EnvC (AmiA/AmiB activator)